MHVNKLDSSHRTRDLSVFCPYTNILYTDTRCTRSSWCEWALIHIFLARRSGTHLPFLTMLFLEKNTTTRQEMAQPNTILWHDWLLACHSPYVARLQRTSAFAHATKLASQQRFKAALNQRGLWLNLRRFLKKKKKHSIETFYRTHFLLLSSRCLSRYISLSFYRPALPETTLFCE